MSGNTFGKIFSFTTFGESHGEALGVIVDGMPSMVDVDMDLLTRDLNRRRPGQSSFSTQRNEGDKPEILSGVFEGRTTGTPISLLVWNTSHRSSDYSEIASYYRPGHADYTFDRKYGFRDYRGGGRSSGRETIGRVAAGAVASKILKEMGIEVMAYTRSIGPIEADMSKFDKDIILSTPTAMPDQDASEKAISYLEACKKETNSVGGCMECVVSGLPAGIGDPVFEKLDANLAKAIMSIGAVKAVEIGDGCAVSSRRGIENNDAFRMVDGKISKPTNHAGGILGGISDGSPIIIRAHVKPTPSIYLTQQTVNQSGKEIDVNIKGRHDPIIVPRAVVVMECMTALTVLDAMMINMSARMDSLTSFYQK